MLTVKQEDSRIVKIEKIREICRKNGSSVMILGVTNTGEMIARYLTEHGIDAEIKYVVDDEYFNTEMQTKGIISFSRYLEEFATSTPLVFGFYNYEVILNKINQYRDVIPYMYDFHITRVNGEIVDWRYEYVLDHFDQYEETYEMLSGEESKACMQAYLNAAIAGEFHELFVNYRDVVPYFNEKLDGRKIDRLFDCGAFDGDSAHDYIKTFPEYDHIYEFEPDESNIEKIEKRVLEENIHDLTIIDKGVWSETMTLRFKSEGSSSSSVSEEGDLEIEVIKLDDMYDLFTRDSLIKMDIEGSELEALKGASRVISEISPALAICVYHKSSDLITIPQFISRLVNPGTYEYHIGYQGLDLAELVFYALPNNTDD